MKTLREFRKMDDNQAYLCSDRSIAEEHKLTLPFRCGSRLWMGGGVVRVEFFSNVREIGQQFQVSSYTPITTLAPIKGERWEFDPVIEL